MAGVLLSPLFVAISLMTAIAVGVAVLHRRLALLAGLALIAGLMGAGRTELLECLFGAAGEQPQGRIELLGKSVVFRHPREFISL